MMQIPQELHEVASGPEARAGGIEISVVIPLYNEEGNIEALHRELLEALRAQPRSFEIIYVNDGSTDRTADRLEHAVRDEPRACIVELARRFGQTAALAAGFRRARGEVIVPMDGDLQNDPRDIIPLVDRLQAGGGWDIVSGWRKDRQDVFWTRRLPSLAANYLIRKLTRTPEVHDFGCTLKAYRRSVLDKVQLYGEMHRFLPAICKWHGARVTEEEVTHRPRIHGASKYGLRRTFKVLLDLITVKFLGDYLTKPLYFFGKIALVTLASSFLSLGIALAQKWGLFGLEPLRLNRNVLVFFAMMLFLMSVLFVMMGVISELLVRIYHQTMRGPFYTVRRFRPGGAAVGTTAADPLEEA